MRTWVTGIAGFLGSHLYDALTAQGHEVLGNDSLICGDSENAPHLIPIDCRNFNLMKSALSSFRPDVLIHSAATAHEGFSSFSPSFITKNIYEASVATFSAAIASGVKRIVYMSSMSRYGNNIVPFDEEQTPNPVDPYAVAKVASENTLRILAKTHGIEHVIAVPHNIIGPRQRYVDPYRNVAAIMINRCLQGKPIIIYGDGKQKRSFSPISDCIHSLTKMIDAPIDGEIINIGPDSGEMTVSNLAEIIIRLTGSKCGIIHVDDRPNEVKEAYCSSDKAKRLLGYMPQDSVEDCLKVMVDYIKQKGAKPFKYDFGIEIEKGCPLTWKDKLI